jgi:putative oxidoreductase
LNLTNIGLLFFRVGFGLMMAFGHGLGKLSNFSQYATQFPALFGMSPKFALGVAVFTEFFCALFVILGLFTRASAALIAVTMAVAAFVVHAADPFSSKELALVYLIAFGAIALIGPGEISVEAKRRRGW